MTDEEESTETGLKSSSKGQAEWVDIPIQIVLNKDPTLGMELVITTVTVMVKPGKGFDVKTTDSMLFDRKQYEENEEESIKREVESLLEETDVVPEEVEDEKGKMRKLTDEEREERARDIAEDSEELPGLGWEDLWGLKREIEADKEIPAVFSKTAYMFWTDEDWEYYGDATAQNSYRWMTEQEEEFLAIASKAQSRLTGDANEADMVWGQYMLGVREIMDRRSKTDYMEQLRKVIPVWGFLRLKYAMKTLAKKHPARYKQLQAKFKKGELPGVLKDHDEETYFSSLSTLAEMRRWLKAHITEIPPFARRMLDKGDQVAPKVVTKGKQLTVEMKKAKTTPRFNPEGYTPEEIYRLSQVNYEERKGKFSCESCDFFLKRTEYCRHRDVRARVKADGCCIVWHGDSQLSALKISRKPPYMYPRSNPEGDGYAEELLDLYNAIGQDPEVPVGWLMADGASPQQITDAADQLLKSDLIDPPDYWAITAAVAGADYHVGVPRGNPTVNGGLAQRKNSPKRQPKIYSKVPGIKAMLKRFDLSPAAEIYIMPAKQLIKEFDGDEEVEYDFLEEGYIAKTRNRDEEDPQILVASDLHEGEKEEMVISVLHELEHIRGETSEEKAEAKARKRFDNLIKNPPANEDLASHKKLLKAVREKHGDEPEQADRLFKKLKIIHKEKTDEEIMDMVREKFGLKKRKNPSVKNAREALKDALKRITSIVVVESPPEPTLEESVESLEHTAKQAIAEEGADEEAEEAVKALEDLTAETVKDDWKEMYEKELREHPTLSPEVVKRIVDDHMAFKKGLAILGHKGSGERENPSAQDRVVKAFWEKAAAKGPKVIPRSGETSADRRDEVTIMASRDIYGGPGVEDDEGMVLYHLWGNLIARLQNDARGHKTLAISTSGWETMLTNDRLQSILREGQKRYPILKKFAIAKKGGYTWLHKIRKLKKVDPEESWRTDRWEPVCQIARTLYPLDEVKGQLPKYTTYIDLDATLKENVDRLTGKALKQDIEEIEIPVDTLEEVQNAIDSVEKSIAEYRAANNDLDSTPIEIAEKLGTRQKFEELLKQRDELMWRGNPEYKKRTEHFQVLVRTWTKDGEERALIDKTLTYTDKHWINTRDAVKIYNKYLAQAVKLWEDEKIVGYEAYMHTVDRAGKVVTRQDDAPSYWIHQQGTSPYDLEGEKDDDEEETEENPKIPYTPPDAPDVEVKCPVTGKYTWSCTRCALFGGRSEQFIECKAKEGRKYYLAKTGDKRGTVWDTYVLPFGQHKAGIKTRAVGGD